LLLLGREVLSQEKFYTKTGRITFFSSAPMEDIEANHKSVTSLLNTQSGELRFSLMMKGFEFKKALMQEHFNKKFVESDKYPKAEFNGAIVNNSEINYAVPGRYDARVKGRLTIHGQTREVEVKGSVTVKEGQVDLHSIFTVLVADYNISIPRIYRDNIARSLKITVECALKPL